MMPSPRQIYIQDDLRWIRVFETIRYTRVTIIIDTTRKSLYATRNRLIGQDRYANSTKRPTKANSIYPLLSQIIRKII